MLSRFAHVLLVATSLAPVALIYGVSKAREDWRVCLVFVAVALTLAIFCNVLLGVATRKGEIEQVVVAKSKTVDKEALSFLVTYALPLLVPTDKTQNVLALVAFIVVVFIVLLQLQVAHVNPLLAAFRYHFFEVSPPSGETAIMITRRLGAPGPTRIVKLSPLIWLELPT